MAHDLATAERTARQRMLALFGLYASIFAFSISFGGLVPWMALDMEDRGISAALIGLVAAAHPLGVLLMAPFTQRIVHRFGCGNAMIGSTIVAVVALLPLASWNSVYAWLGLRFIGGLSGSIPWVVTETWINIAATDRNRGRAVALYTAIMAAGFATGPIALQWADMLGVSPLPWFIGLQLISLVIIIPLRRLAPVLEHNGGAGLVGVFCALPALLSAAFLSGALDSTFFSFLAIWGQRVGLHEHFALTLLSIFIAGNVLLQFPIGWLADLWGPRPVLLGCGIACIAAPLLVLAGLPAVPILLGIVAFLWGGCAWGTYSVALVAMGRRFTGGALVVINAAFVMAYTFANIVMPPVAGFAMEGIWDPHAVMVVALLVAAGFTLLIWRRRGEF